MPDQASAMISELADITTILMAIIAFVSWLAKLYFKFKKAQTAPKTKKHISFIKNSLSFILRYILPIAAIIYLMIVTNKVDKFFVLSLGLNLCAFFSNLISDTLDRLLKNENFYMYYINSSAELHTYWMEQIKSLKEDSKDNTNQITSLIEHNKEMNGIIRDIIKMIK